MSQKVKGRIRRRDIATANPPTVVGQALIYDPLEPDDLRWGPASGGSPDINGGTAAAGGGGLDFNGGDSGDPVPHDHVDGGIA